MHGNQVDDSLEEAAEDKQDGEEDGIAGTGGTSDEDPVGSHGNQDIEVGTAPDAIAAQKIEARRIAEKDGKKVTESDPNPDVEAGENRLAAPDLECFKTRKPPKANKTPNSRTDRGS